MIFGISLGITLPIGTLYLSEIIPFNMRGKFLILLPVFFTLGELYYVFLAYVFLTSMTEGNWRMIAVFNAIPCFFLLLGNYFILEESPRYLIVNK